MRWMKLEPSIQSEVSQKDKHQYSILTHIYGILKDGNDNTICKRETETQMYRTDFWTLGEREGGMIWENSIETGILSRVKLITSPGWMHETSAQGWCSRITQRDGMGREAGGGIGMGNTCKSTADSCKCMAKPLQYCKVISLQLIKINEKKKEYGMITVYDYS